MNSAQRKTIEEEMDLHELVECTPEELEAIRAEFHRAMMRPGERRWTIAELIEELEGDER